MDIYNEDIATFGYIRFIFANHTILIYDNHNFYYSDGFAIVVDGNLVQTSGGGRSANFNFSMQNNIFYIYKNSSLIYSISISDGTLNGLYIWQYRTGKLIIQNIQLIDNAGIVYSQSGIRFNLSNSGLSDFIQWTNFKANVSVIGGMPQLSIEARYKDNPNAQWSSWIQLDIGSNINNFSNYIEVVIKNNATKGNDLNLSNMNASYYQQQNIPLSICNLTNMSILQALEELASLAIYEIVLTMTINSFLEIGSKHRNIKL
ncbi:MAG: hypothetical protein LBD46_03375 [Endomicrobium sp.]|jgi:hypothetical protein|nr:hypothetical protein [Endomicrobium sp.]